MTIKVLHLLHRLTFGGTERVVVNLVKRSSPEVINFIGSFDEPDPEFLKELGSLKHRVFSMHKRLGNDMSLPFRIARFCKHRHVDIVHSLGWGTYSEGLIAAKILSKKIRFVHSFRGKTEEDTNHIPFRRIMAQRIFSLGCDAIITPSEMSRKEYASLIGIDSKKIAVVYNGVKVHDFKVSSDDMRRRDHFGLHSHDIVIGCVARLDPVKNVAGLILTFGRMREKEIADQCKLFIVGDGPQLLDLKRLAAEVGVENRVVFAGMRRDIPHCLGLMDIYVQPSKFEGVPNAVLEAMAAGLPVVATNVGGVSEIVEDGVTGFLVAPIDNGDWSQRILDLVMDKTKRNKMGASGRERVKIYFSMEKMVYDYEYIYGRILRNEN